MERKRFDSLESWSMILESENVETWEASNKDREEWTADLSQLFIGNKFASGAHSRIYRGIYKQRAVAVKMVRIPTHNEETRALLEQQFKSEVALLSRLYHPNIVQVRFPFSLSISCNMLLNSHANKFKSQLSQMGKKVKQCDRLFDGLQFLNIYVASWYCPCTWF